MSWRQEYLAALQARDANEHANKEIYDAYTKLADCSAGSENTVPARTSEQLDSGSPGQNSFQATVQIKSDLLEAQKARENLQNRLDEFGDETEKLRSKAKDDGRRNKQLSTERDTLLLKVKDRDEELRAKRKLLDDVHDETIALTLQINMKIQQAKKLEDENKELVDRWMAQKRQEAEAMNSASKFS